MFARARSRRIALDTVTSRAVAVEICGAQTPASRRRSAAGATLLSSVTLSAGLLVSGSAAAANCPALPAPNENEVVDPALTGVYRAYPLPAIPGADNVDTGGLQVDRADPNLFYVIDNSEDTTTTLRSIRVARDTCGHVIGWQGTSTLIASIPFGDANLLQGPANTFVFSEWPENHISQLAAGATATTWQTDMTPLGVNDISPRSPDSFRYGTSGLAYVPVGYTTTGQLRTMTYGGDVFSVPFSADPLTGQYTLSATTFLVNVPNYPGGMAYIAAGSPGLSARGLVILEYGTNTLAAYVTDAAGTPNGARTQILSVANGALGGGFSDPISGDLYWTSWGYDDLVHVVAGFATPECATDADCHSSLWCSAVTTHCTPKVLNGAGLPSDAGHAGAALDGTCSTGAAVAACVSGQCNASTNTCGAGNGNGCATAAECSTNLCGSNSLCGGADATGTCTALDQATTCQSGVCSANGGICIPSAANQCWVDADCTGQFCSRSTTSCSARLALGAALPSDGLHDTCVGGVDAACASGACNVRTATCAAANGSTCSGAAACVSNVCASDGACGYAALDGPCTSANQATVCRSGICGTALFCLSAGGCAEDEDCAAHQYCDAGPHTCADRLASGQRLPADGLYATCSAAGTNGACASGHCDASAGLCGAPLSTSCSGATDCASGICATTTLKCATCSQDSQCANDLFCSAAGSCSTRLADGFGCDRAAQCTSSTCENALCGHVTPVVPREPATFHFATPENSGCSLEREPGGAPGRAAFGAMFALVGLGALRRRAQRAR